MQGKRQRDDSQVSKNEYWRRQESGSASAGTFPRASSATLADRKMVRPRPSAINDALRAATKDLNARFLAHLTAQRDGETASVDAMLESWEPLVKDYITHARHLRTFYRRRGGVVLAWGPTTVGSRGGHDADGAPVSLRAGSPVKKLKASTSATWRRAAFPPAVSSSGRVFTCGVNDDGALGRHQAEDARRVWGAAGARFAPSTISTGLLAYIHGSSSSRAVCLPARARGASCGRGLLDALDLDGTVWTWGAYRTRTTRPFTTQAAPTRALGAHSTSPTVNFSGTGSGTTRVAPWRSRAFILQRCAMRDGSMLTWARLSGQLGRGKTPVLRPDPHS